MVERQHRDGIHPRGKDTHRVVVAAGRDPLTGKYVQIRETVHGSPRDARVRRDALRTDVARGTVTQSKAETVSDYLERFITHRQSTGKVRPKTADVYRGYVRREIASRIGGMRLSDVRPVHIQAVLDEAIARGLSARSVLQIHRILHAAFRQAVRWHLLAVNPSDGVSPPSPTAPDIVSPSPEQIVRLLEAADERMRPALAVLAGLGLRRGELAALKWDAVELDDPPSLTVVGSLQRADGVLRVMPPKTERSKRTLPLPASLVSVFRRVRTEQNGRRLIAGTAWRDEGFVFDRADGRPLDPDDLTKAFQLARKRSGVEGVRLHDLRHAFATLQMKSGTNPRVVSDLLGHATVSFTMQTYSHPDAGMAAEAMAHVDRAFGEGLNR